MKPSLKLPVWFEAPAEPIRVAPIHVDASTTPRRLALRTIMAARRYTVPGALLTIGHQLGEALVPVIMGLAIDRALATGDVGQLLLWVALLGVNFAMLSYSYRFGSRVSYLGMQAIQHHLRTRVTDRLLAPRNGDKATLPGASLSIATSDVLRLSTLVAIGVYPVGMFAGVIFCAVVLLTISWPLGLAVLIGTPLLLFLLDKADGPLRRRTEKQQELAADAAGNAADLITGYRVIKGIGAETEAAQRYLRSSQEALDATLRAKTAQGFYTGSTNLVTGLFIAALAVAAGIFALNKQLSIGQLITVVGLTQFIMSPLQGLAGIVAAFWPPGLASAGRILPVLRDSTAEGSDEADELATTVAKPETGLEFAAVTAGALRDFSLRVEPEEFVGVAAEGETARVLTELLSLRREPESGELTFDGEPLATADPEAMRRRILAAPHSADLFDGTIRDNVALAGADRVEAALDASGCREFIDVLPDGLDTVVGEGGTRLSGGQRQRVALARALARPVPLLVLHDPTTAVDSVTEAGIAERLAKVRDGLATLVITSSPALLAACDRVVRLDEAADASPHPQENP
ncbi:ABC transporter ATP-binding protein [Stackebrandtia nassauensis]|uniref:ABC transporter related protein n=1 Tax=Stackebrandtia nassauensis (strain DSM 44728 / CIP 108903 / NRRL B-16338 / NBRC 102104 / LLR-40K-21) TaxID=446470 RepID=D3Q1A8_STANL|nr:ABC transporter ATP-binding protein [Stackebrandtia nassauensis]ADD45688.1 ABC transporter related protein [Stackebrandtia nassauensis DSM 44728]